jgi:hypothetical protein
MVGAVAVAVRAIQKREARARRNVFFGNRHGLDLTADQAEQALRRAKPTPTIPQRPPGYPEMPK